MTKVLQFEHHKKNIFLAGPKVENKTWQKYWTRQKNTILVELHQKLSFWGVTQKSWRLKLANILKFEFRFHMFRSYFLSFCSPHLHQPWLSAGVQNALVCNCPKFMRWCFTCMFISWCKYWQRTIVDKSTYDKIYWKKGSTKIHFFQKASESSRTQNIISFSQSKTRAGHQKHSQNDEFHLFIVNCTCFCKKNSWHHVIGHFEKHPLVHLIPLVFLTQSQTLGKKQHTLEK